VAHSLSAKKRVRQTAKRNARNRARKDALKGQVKAFLSAITAGDAAKAQTELNKTARHLDRISLKGTIHRNAAARKRSRLAKRLNLLKKGAKGTVAASA
jgi:small subunit ribosomal protein S20